MQRTFQRLRTLASVALLAAAGLTGTALAQDYPVRQVTLIVPYPAGSTTDIIARLIATPLGQRLKQTIVVDNRSGAGGAVGVRALKQAPNDGYTMGLIVSGNAIQPWLQKDMPFDIRKDFALMSLMYSGLYVLSVTPNFPAKTMAEFVSYVKANPGKVNFGSSGPATTTHLAGELLKQVGGLDIVHVPFKGSPEVYAGMGSGDIQAAWDLYGTSKPMIEGGRIRPLAVSSKTRFATLPTLPAIAETVPGYEILAWTGFAFPLGTPPAAVNRMATELRAVMAQADIKKRVNDMGIDIGGNSPQEFQAFVNAEYDKWGRVIQAAGLKPQ